MVASGLQSASASTDDLLPSAVLRPAPASKPFDFAAFFRGRAALAIFMVACGLALITTGLHRHIFYPVDGRHPSDDPACNSILSSGHWLSTPHSRYEKWQPLSGNLVDYSKKDSLAKCVDLHDLYIVGDSTARGLFNAIGKSAGFVSSGHRNASFSLGDHSSLTFLWDPFMNETQIDLLPGRDPVVIVSYGSWHMKHFVDYEGKRIYAESLVRLYQKSHAIKGNVYVLPVVGYDEFKLSPERHALKNSLAKHYRYALRKLFDRWVSSPTPFYLAESSYEVLRTTIHLSADGLHNAEDSYMHAANLILNHACNGQLSSGVACGNYSFPNWKQVLTMLFFVIFGPISWCLRRFGIVRESNFIPSSKNASAVSIAFAMLLSCYIADRTSLFAKYQKQFNPFVFSLLTLAYIVAACFTLETGKTDGFLNRNLTDEWKGWMQLFILVYHYTGASRISPIYNFARILVASYLFMTGYGHFMYFYKKRDFSAVRVVKTLVRLNLLCLGLSYIMDFPLQKYYFSPLVSLWFLIIWATMWFKSDYNVYDWFICFKLALGASLSYGITRKVDSYLLDAVKVITSTRMDTKEWHFRFTLDILIVWIGALVAFLICKEERWNSIHENVRNRFVLMSSILSAVLLVGYFAFEATLDKFTYNVYEPFVSCLPIIAYILLRNRSPYCRKTSSRFFRFFGQISLETFILQFHIWLAVDTSSLLVVFPESPTLNFFLTSFIFVFISARASDVTAELSEWVCEKKLTHAKLIGAFLGFLFIINHIPPF